MQDDLIAVTQADTMRAGELLSSVFGAEYARSDTNIEAIAVFLAAHRQQAEDAIIRAADDWLSTQYGLRPLVTDLARIRATPPKPDRLNGEGE